MKKKFTADEVILLLESENYRDFISRFLTLKIKSHKKYGYSHLARQAGFASRSFPRDIVMGRKNITLFSINKFIRGMSLDSDLSQYFRYLVEIKHENCRQKQVTDQQLEKARNNLKSRLVSRNQKKTAEDFKKANAYEYFQSPKVYAALGPLDLGATLKEIIHRTQLDENTVALILNKLIEDKIIKKIKNKFYAIENHLDLTGLGQSEVFKNFYLQCLEEALRQARLNFNTDNALHFVTAFSINRKDLPALKENLKSLLLQYVDQNEDSKGDYVTKITCSLF